MPPEISTYHELAAILRAQIVAGDLPPGAFLPGEKRLAQEYGVGGGLVRRALTTLRNEGLIEAVRGQSSRVRTPAERQVVKVQRGSRGLWRMPTPDERRDLRIGPGVPVLVVTYAGKTTVFPGDRWEFTTS